MKSIWKKGFGCLIIIAVIGWARLPIEQRVTEYMKQQKLLPQPLPISTRDHIGQTSSAVALGGLRTLVATFLNLRAFSAFSDQKWGELEDIYNIILDLAPRTTYYWDGAAWNMAYNAASYYINDSKLPALRRREEWRTSIFKGKYYFEKGMLNNPKDWRLAAALGTLLSDSNKFHAFKDTNASFNESAKAYQIALDTGDALPFVKRALFYSLSRVKERQAEALQLGRELNNQRGNQTPTLLCILFVLETNADASLDVVELILKLHAGNEKQAYDNLTNYWRRSVEDKLPMNEAFVTAIARLETQMLLPAEKSVLNEPTRIRNHPDDWFK